MKLRVLLAGAGLSAAAALVGQLRAGSAPAPPTAAWGNPAGGCTPSTGPDVIVSDLNGISRYGPVGDITAYAIGTTSCNIGSTTLLWDADSPNHPVIAQNLYRLKDGRFEQIGMGWLKHGFAAGIGNECCPCQNPADSQVLGVGCSDIYGSFLNGLQQGSPCKVGICGGLGPRYEVNPTTGSFAYPYNTIGVLGDAIYKRIQVLTTDVDTAFNAGAKYYGEGHYVTPDDSAAANHHNNASYQEILVTAFHLGSWVLQLTGTTTREQPAIDAWQVEDPQVVIEIIEDDGGAIDDHDGRFYLGYRVTDNGDGTWHYEYALYNMNSHLASRSFSVEVPPGVTVSNIGYHDVDHHSGDGEGGVNHDGTDWVEQDACGAATWETSLFADDPNANALRWGTLFNFRFDADTPPAAATATIGLFRPSTPQEVTAPALGPGAQSCPWDLDGDGQVGITDLFGLFAVWGTDSCGPPDFDDNGNAGIEDLFAMFGQWGPC